MSFQQIPKKKTTRHSEPGETSQASDNVQETMAHILKTEAEEGPSNLQQGAEEQEYNFCFSSDFNRGPVFVSGNISMTVLDALETRDTFSLNKNVNDVKKEIVILRADGAAVKKDFPCCLIKKDENLKIIFINKGKNAFTVKEKQEIFLPPRTGLVTFYIETTGKKKMKYIMKNNELTEQADYVCVYAFRGEKVETALERDGRFIDTIFQKLCVLTLKSREGANENGILKNYEMSERVERLDKKTFQIVAVRDKRPDIQKKPIKVKTESDVASAADSAQNDPDQHPIGTEQISGNSGKSGTEEFLNANTEQEETQKIERVNSTKTSAKYYEINNSEEILEILCSQFDILLKLLMQREKLKKNSVFQKFFRAEYDKSVQSFSEVYKIKQLMKLSDSVCQIRVEGFAKGTGFLLFGRFVLTNAHVVKDFLESPDKLSSTKHLEAAFDFERLDSKVKLVPVKKQLAAYCFLTDADKSHLDFALLELDVVDEITGRPGLLSRYNGGSPPNRGGICIVGHPDGGIKKADPCFIVENLQEAADKHISENDKFIHVMTQKCFENKWDVYKNQINYNSCFFYGSSGSPVFNEDCDLIGVHTGGYVYPGEKGKTRSIVEYAYSIQPILDMIRAQAKIKGLHEVVNTLEAYSNKSNESGTAEQDNQTDWEMEGSD